MEEIEHANVVDRGSDGSAADGDGMQQFLDSSGGRNRAGSADDRGPVPGRISSPVERTNPLANDPVALQDGRRLFDWYNCSGCHGGHAGGGMGPSLRDQVWLYGSRDDQIFDSIAEGRSNGMPAWGTKIPERQIWELVAYIKSMRTPQEPDPPIEPANEQTPNPENNQRMMVGTQAQH